jgi:NADPH:quinone reductase-like Zn-dependent oxidoreductase
MKAIVLNEYGDSSKLVPASLDEPKPAEGELEVRVAAAGLNPIDWKVRSGAMKAFIPLDLPAVLGRDVSGQVVALGSAVTGFAIGDTVMGLVQHGYAELVTAPATTFARVPAGLSLEDAAVIPLAGLTGTQLAEEVADVQRNQTVLVTGAVGPVGRFAAWAARKRGARVIAGVRGRQLNEARELGVLASAIDDDGAISALPPLDVICDTVGGATVAKLSRRVRDGGLIVSTVGQPPADPTRTLRVKGMLVHPDGKRLAALARAVADGEVKLPIARRFPMEQAAQAHQFAEAGPGGKVLLTV